MLEDLLALRTLNLPSTAFADAEYTKARLALLTYCHMTEMNFPYELLANLLRLRLGRKYKSQPFIHLFQRNSHKAPQAPVDSHFKPPSPEKKIKEIESLAVLANFPEVGAALRGTISHAIRNAVYHSDYVLHERSLRLLRGRYLSSRSGELTHIVKFDELSDFIDEALGFYSALLSLSERLLKSFTDYKDKFLPFDPYYKGLLELTFDADKLSGFRAYWPNGSTSYYARTKQGLLASNLRFDSDGSVNFLVGRLAKYPGTFSPCVEKDQKPVYAVIPGGNIAPYWPDNPERLHLPISL